MYNYIDILFPALQRTLSDPADEVVQQCLVVIAEVVSSQTSSDAEKCRWFCGKEYKKQSNGRAFFRFF